MMSSEVVSQARRTNVVRALGDFAGRSWRVTLNIGLSGLGLGVFQPHNGQKFGLQRVNLMTRSDDNG
jgi:hypothetical protein